MRPLQNAGGIRYHRLGRYPSVYGVFVTSQSDFLKIREESPSYDCWMGRRGAIYYVNIEALRSFVHDPSSQLFYGSLSLSGSDLQPIAVPSSSLPCDDIHDSLTT